MSNNKGHETFASLLEMAGNRARDHFSKESIQNLIDYSKVTNWEAVRQNLGLHGTNIAKNAADPMGDGDQLPIRKAVHAQLHRDVWSTGADVQYQLLHSGFSRFVIACIFGSAERCKKMLEECPDQDARTDLLETRFSLLRLSPIFFAAIGFGTIRAVGGASNDGSGNVEVVRLLLKHGARPDARDVCGKTIIHYCCGPLCKPGSKVLLDIADLCITRAAEMSLPKLVDARDRFGGVALQQAVMTMRTDFAHFLCTKYRADANIEDYDGCSPFTMADSVPAVRSIMVTAQSQSNYEQFKAVCLQCRARGMKTFRCSRCNIATYCSKECQVCASRNVNVSLCCTSLGRLTSPGPCSRGYRRSRTGRRSTRGSAAPWTCHPR
jgi:hypothetical protein